MADRFGAAGLLAGCLDDAPAEARRVAVNDVVADPVMAVLTPELRDAVRAACASL